MTTQNISHLVDLIHDNIIAIKHAIGTESQDADMPSLEHPVHGRIPFKLNLHQQIMSTAMAKCRKLLLNCARQSGTTSMLIAHAFKQAAGKKNHHVVFYVPKFSYASRLMDHATQFVEHITRADIGNIKFKNGSSIRVFSSSATRPPPGQIDTLIFDDASFISFSNIEWQVFANISSKCPGSTTIIASAPGASNGMFHSLWTSDQSYSKISLPWFLSPGRDANWAKTELSRIGLDAFKSSYCCEFQN